VAARADRFLVLELRVPGVALVDVELGLALRDPFGDPAIVGPAGDGVDLALLPAPETTKRDPEPFG
jgi:hypothetical protein